MMNEFHFRRLSTDAGSVFIFLREQLQNARPRVIYQGWVAGGRFHLTLRGVFEEFPNKSRESITRRMNYAAQLDVASASR